MVKVTVSPKTVELEPNDYQYFNATVTGTANTAVTWTVTPGGGTISPAGRYTAPAVPGKYTVTATSNADPTKFGTATVTVPAPPTVTVTVWPKTVELKLNGYGYQQFNATVTGATDTSVTWSVSGGGTIDVVGFYLAPAVPGKYTVTATSNADPTKSDTATVTVPVPPTVTVTLSPKTVYLVPEGTQQFTATVTGSTNTEVSWSGAGGGTVTYTGHYTAPKTEGTYYVTATSKADTSSSDTATVIVGNGAPPTVKVTVSPKTAELKPNGTQQFTGGRDGFD